MIKFTVEGGLGLDPSSFKPYRRVYADFDIEYINDARALGHNPETLKAEIAEEFKKFLNTLDLLG